MMKKNALRRKIKRKLKIYFPFSLKLMDYWAKFMIFC